MRGLPHGIPHRSFSCTWQEHPGKTIVQQFLQQTCHLCKASPPPMQRLGTLRLARLNTLQESLHWHVLVFWLKLRNGPVDYRQLKTAAEPNLHLAPWVMVLLLWASATRRLTACALDVGNDPIINKGYGCRVLPIHTSMGSNLCSGSLCCRKKCAACGYPAAKIRSYEWSKKSKRRRAPGTGRMRPSLMVKRCVEEIV